MRRTIVDNWENYKRPHCRLKKRERQEREKDKICKSRKYQTLYKKVNGRTEGFEPRASSSGYENENLGN